MDRQNKIQYALLAEVHGRWKADILESYLRSEEIDVVLAQDAVSHVTHVISFARSKSMFRRPALKGRVT